VVSQLVGSSFANGAMLPNYVNGRLLVAEDLATGQSTLLQRDTMIGQGVGPGIVNGLWVTASANTLTVAAGLGITPSGEPVSILAPVALSLSIAGAPGTPTGASFTNCATSATGAQTAITTGAYLLTAMPACQLEGQAPMAITPGSDTPVACTAQWQVEGVQFKAIPLPFTTLVNGVPEVDGITVTADNTRNLLAHWCFGTAQLANLGADPFNFDQAYRGLDQLAATDLTPGDLPLCVFYWDASQAGAPAISFVDNWSVRRRPTRPDAPDPSASWHAAVTDQRPADGEARFLQFQDQILDLVSAGVSRATVASDVFGLLPPVGFLPVSSASLADDIARLTQTTGDQTDNILSTQVINNLLANVSQLGPQSGFVPTTFFGGMACFFGGLLTWDTVYFALRQSYFLGPIATAQAQSTGQAPMASALGRIVAPASIRTLAPASVRAAASSLYIGPMPIRRPTPFPLIPTAAATSAAPLAAFPDVVLYYYVADNYLGVYNALNGTGPSVTPYLVFMKNQFRYLDTQAPFAHVSSGPPGFTVQASGFSSVAKDFW
jgi:hypothetical protein